MSRPIRSLPRRPADCHLAATVGALHAGAEPWGVVKRFDAEKLAQASYLIGCAAKGEALVVDANRDVEQYIRTAESKGVRYETWRASGNPVERGPGALATAGV